MPMFRKKPVVIEAFQMTLETRWDNSEWPNWLHQAWQRDPGENSVWIDPDAPIAEGRQSANELVCGTLEGVHRITFGDWIIQGVKGELYPCKPDIFAATYVFPHDDPAVNKIYDHVDIFAQDMKDKMTDAYHEGRAGWDDPTCRSVIVKRLKSRTALLCDEDTADDEQAVDVANFAMMLHFFGPVS
jgi:hypothetical protein